MTLPTLTSRAAEIDMSPDEFRAAGHELVDRVADLLAGIADRPVAPGEDRETIRALVGSDRPLPEEGEPAAEVLRSATELLFEHSTFNGHPRFFAYITASAAPIGVLGDMLAAAVNPNVGGWALSPTATEIEAQAVRWIAELIGYPTDCGGLMVSGGNMANMVCFFAARAAMADWDIRAEGAGGREKGQLRAYVSDAAHTWVQKAADLSGLGSASVRWIETDDGQRIRMDRLREQIAADRAAGDLPFMVVGTGGSVSTGAVDPLPEIAALCRDENLWFHVDGAYGGFAAAAPNVPDDLRGLALADSVAVDPHKWLYAPLEAGCALVRDASTLLGAFSYHPDYYNFDPDTTNYFDLGPQNSRGFRALKVWLQLRQVGGNGYRRMIAQDIRLSEALAEAVRAHPDLEHHGQQLSIATFRYVPERLRDAGTAAGAEDYLNRLNQDIQTRLEQGGEAFVSNAVIDGRYLLRACIVNFRTGPADVLALPDIVARVGAEADAALAAGEEA